MRVKVSAWPLDPVGVVPAQTTPIPAPVELANERNAPETVTWLYWYTPTPSVRKSRKAPARVAEERVNYPPHQPAVWSPVAVWPSCVVMMPAEPAEKVTAFGTQRIRPLRGVSREKARNTWSLVVPATV